MRPLAFLHPATVAEAEEVGLLPKPKGPRVRVGRLERLLQRKDADAAAIATAPATANRATRRSVGLWGHIWRWDLRGTEMQRTFVPRYIRRHYSAAAPLTRRQRRHQARVLRITRSRGLLR